MHPLHDYLAKQLADKLSSRRVVVWYDKRRDFQAFVDEVRGGPRASSDPVPVSVGGETASLTQFAGSMLEMRAVVEPFVNGDTPAPVILYLSGSARDPHASVLMELERSGAAWDPDLIQLARNVLLEKYTLGVVDEMLPAGRNVSYEDFALAAEGANGPEPPSILKSIFHDTTGNDSLIAAWIANDSQDEEIIKKDANRELAKLVKAVLGLDLPTDASLTKLRAITVRYILTSEFRLDLSCDPPHSLDGIPKPESSEHEKAVRALARSLRMNFADSYITLADQLEQQYGLSTANLPAKALGSIDTFRFEERALLKVASDSIAGREFKKALALVSQREDSFWLNRDVRRKAQWEAVRRMAELGDVASKTRSAVARATGDSAAWVGAYVAKDGWYLLDRAARRLEALASDLDGEPDEHAIGVVRRDYEDTCYAMAEDFTKALVRAGWSVRGTLHQTQSFNTLVSPTPKPVAYFLVDAMRYEMGVELSGRLPKTSEVSIRPAVGAIPTITPIGMAALMPGASASFSVVEQGDKLGVRIDGSFLADLTGRKKYAASRLPKLVDVALDDLLGLAPSKLKKKLADAEVIIVRSQEIDFVGESGFMFAHRIMDSVIDNIARAIGKLASAGISHAVVTADHGHLLFPAERDDSMKIDAPGGDTIDLHRRCWIGRGGKTPVGCERVSASALGYDSDLDFVFPTATGVFKAGGDLAYHHGGVSLQELIVPVLSVRTTTSLPMRSSTGPIAVSQIPDAVTNRVFSVTLAYRDNELTFGAEPLKVRPLLITEGKRVGAAGLAVGASFDRSSESVTLEPNKPASVGFILNDDTAASVHIVIQDPATDAELYRSPHPIPVRLSI